jgi:hypothetical protein
MLLVTCIFFFFSCSKNEQINDDQGYIEPNLKKRIEHLGSFYKDYRCVIFENDSKDE